MNLKNTEYPSSMLLAHVLASPNHSVRFPSGVEESCAIFHKKKDDENTVLL